jgi:hypothetical protein
MTEQLTIVQDLTEGLHGRLDDITREPFPRRWVELIHYLNALERRQPRPDSSAEETCNVGTELKH